jgi:hypothetical protein
MDFTISERNVDSLGKNAKKYSLPLDYKEYYGKKYKRKLNNVPRVVFTL